MLRSLFGRLLLRRSRIGCLALRLRIGVDRVGRRFFLLLFFVGLHTVAVPQGIVRDVFERQAGGVLASPIGQPRADRLGVLKTRNVVAAKATVLGDCLAADVL